MNKFWNWIKDEDTGERVLRLEGPVDSDDTWGDTVTPQAFRDELESEEGDVTVWINSPGGSVFAAAEIYTMLCDHKGKITVKIASIAASAASVIAMAGEKVQMSPTALLMVHDPMTIAMGNARDMEKAISTLNEVKESIINAYQRKTGLSRNKIAKLMEDETWLNAKKAVQLGFADEILFDHTPKAGLEPDAEEEDHDEKGTVAQPEAENFCGEGLYSSRGMGKVILNRIYPDGVPALSAEADDGTAAGQEDMEPSEEGMTQDVSGVMEDAGQEERPAMAEEPENPLAHLLDQRQVETIMSEILDGFANAMETRIQAAFHTWEEAFMAKLKKDDDDDKDDEDDDDEDGDDEGEDGEDESEEEPDPPEKKPVKKEKKTASDTLVLDREGRTPDGAMPYELLMSQLELLR